MIQVLRWVFLPVMFWAMDLVFGFLWLFFVPDSVMASVLGHLCFLPLGFWYFRKCGGRTGFFQKEEKHLYHKFLRSGFWVTVLVWFATQTVSICLMPFAEQKTDMYLSMTEASGYWYLFLTILVAPVAEELVFRGILFSGLRRLFGFWFSCIVTSLLFAWMHQYLPQYYLGFFCGVLFTILLERTGTLWYAIAAHVLYNLMSVVCAWMLYREFWYEPWVLALLNAGMYLGLIWLYRFGSKSRTGLSTTAESMARRRMSECSSDGSEPVLPEQQYPAVRHQECGGQDFREADSCEKPDFEAVDSICPLCITGRAASTMNGLLNGKEIYRRILIQRKRGIEDGME